MEIPISVGNTVVHVMTYFSLKLQRMKFSNNKDKKNTPSECYMDPWNLVVIIFVFITEIDPDSVEMRWSYCGNFVGLGSYGTLFTAEAQYYNPWAYICTYLNDVPFPTSF